MKDGLGNFKSYSACDLKSVTKMKVGRKDYVSNNV